MYHISDLKKFNRCPRIYVLDQNSPKTPFVRYVRLDDEVTILAAQKIGATDYFVGERGDDPNRAIEALNQYEWLTAHQSAVSAPHRSRVGSVFPVYRTVSPQ